MSSDGVLSGEPRLHRLSTWFDPETAAVVTILLGLFQVMLSVLLIRSNEMQPDFFVLPLVLGILIVAGGSFTMASERNPSKKLLQGCACSNVVGLLGAVIAFCLYSYSLSVVQSTDCVAPAGEYEHECPSKYLAAYCWSVTLLLLLYDSGAVVLHCLVSVSAFKALKIH